MAVRSTQGQNRAVRSTPGGRGVSPSIVPDNLEPVPWFSDLL